MPDPAPTVRWLLFEGETAGREVSAEDLAHLLPVGDRQLLWVDVSDGVL